MEIAIFVGTIVVIGIAIMIYCITTAPEMEETSRGMVKMTTEIKRATNELKYMNDDKVFMTVILDFDGTVCQHRYPNVGDELPHCVETLKRWQEKYKVGYILSTMRSGRMLDDAVNWFKNNGIELFGIQQHPTQHQWTNSPKCHGRWCIDDRNVGQPLTIDPMGAPCVDWEKTVEIFEPTLRGTYAFMMEEIEKQK